MPKNNEHPIDRASVLAEQIKALAGLIIGKVNDSGDCETLTLATILEEKAEEIETAIDAEIKEIVKRK